MELFTQLTLAELTAWVVVVALNVYVLFGGADFGGGVWDLLASGERAERQRSLIVQAMGPIWEANHVWLIVVVVLLFVCFPTAFAAFGTILHIALSLMLIGIVLRGSAFVFRAYSYGPDSTQRQWGRVFASSSVITPLVLGMCVGAVASGSVGEALALLGYGPAAVLPTATVVTTEAVTPPSFVALYVAPWLSPFAVAVGVMTLMLLSFLAATYLTIEAEGDAPLQEDFRRRALGAGVAALAAAGAALALGLMRGGVMARLVGTRWPLSLVIASTIAALTALVALVRRHYQVARVAVGAQVTFVLWGWVLAQFPLIIPPRLTIDEAAAPASTLSETLIVLLFGAVILVPSLWYLLRVFKGRVPATRTP